MLIPDELFAMDVLDELLGAGVDGHVVVRLCRDQRGRRDIVEEVGAGFFALLVLAVLLGRENGRRGREGAPFLMNSSMLGLLIIDFVRLSYPQWLMLLLPPPAENEAGRSSWEIGFR